jgi:hypothetical protein
VDAVGNEIIGTIKNKPEIPDCPSGMSDRFFWGVTFGNFRMIMVYRNSSMSKKSRSFYIRGVHGPVVQVDDFKPHACH